MSVLWTQYAQAHKEAKMHVCVSVHVLCCVDEVLSNSLNFVITDLDHETMKL